MFSAKEVCDIVDKLAWLGKGHPFYSQAANRLWIAVQWQNDGVIRKILNDKVWRPQSKLSVLN